MGGWGDPPSCYLKAVSFAPPLHTHTHTQVKAISFYIKEIMVQIMLEKVRVSVSNFTILKQDNIKFYLLVDNSNPSGTQRNPEIVEIQKYFSKYNIIDC